MSKTKRKTEQAAPALKLTNAKNAPCSACGKVKSPNGFELGVPRDEQGRCTDCAPVTGGGCGLDRGCEFLRIHKWDPTHGEQILRMRLCAHHDAIRREKMGASGRLPEHASKGAAA